jgi:ribosome maturation factor RimP
MDKEKLKESIGEELEIMGYELIDFKFNPVKNGLLRMDIESTKGVDINDCEIVSKRIAVLLDVILPENHSYNLEVSSPGPKRKLFKKQHFIDHVSCNVKIKYRNIDNEVIVIVGKLVESNEDLFKVSENSKLCEVRYENVINANLNM